MNKSRLKYFEQEDVLHLVISDEPESRSIELSPNITVELNDKNEMIGVEILKASAFLGDTVQIGIDRCWRGRQSGCDSDCEIVDGSL
jgi:uncharacterized protein YuzE